MSVSVDRPRAVIVLVADGRRCVVAVVDQAVPCDLGLVERLLWLRFNAHRLGWSVVLEDVDQDLLQLLDLVGVRSTLIRR